MDRILSLIVTVIILSALPGSTLATEGAALPPAGCAEGGRCSMGRVLELGAGDERHARPPAYRVFELGAGDEPGPIAQILLSILQIL